MKEELTVFVNDSPVKLYRGMLVKHALLSHDYALYKAAETGEIIVEDENGFRVGLEGSLHHGARVFTRRVKK